MWTFVPQEPMKKRAFVTFAQVKLNFVVYVMLTVVKNVNLIIFLTWFLYVYNLRTASLIPMPPLTQGTVSYVQLNLIIVILVVWQHVIIVCQVIT